MGRGRYEFYGNGCKFVEVYSDDLELDNFGCIWVPLLDEGGVGYPELFSPQIESLPARN